MKRYATIASCLLIAALAGVSVWQWRTITELEERVREAETNAAAAARMRSSPPVHMPVHSPHGEAPPPGKEVTSPVAGKDAVKINKVASAKPKTPGAGTVESASPVNPLELTPERKRALMDGRESFNPGPIEESSIPVTDKTALTKGQSLQINYYDTWYAGEVVGFESDGGIHVRYFGWASSWDEVVPRSDLRLDPQAREHAVEKYGSQATTAAQF